MKPIFIRLENRKGDKTTVNLTYTARFAYCEGNIPKIFIDCGINPFWVLAGAHMPDPSYDPYKDTISVELIYEDDTTECPYPKGHVDLADLYQRLTHADKVSEPKDIKA